MTDPRPFRVSLHTLGCRLNQAETATIGERFRALGWEVVPFGDPSELCVVNTCSVTHVSEQKCRQAIRAIARRVPDARIVVTGCYAQVAPDRMAELPNVALVVGTADKMDVPALADGLVRDAGAAARVVHRRRFDRGPFEQPGVADDPWSTRAHLKIQDGCSFGCAYCIVPRARGPARSRAFADIVREAGELVRRGYRELVLTGVNVGAWAGEDRDVGVALDVGDVIDAVGGIPGLDRLRISSIEPSTAEAIVLDRLERGGTVCRHLHLPLQSGDDRILAAMGRRYTAARYATFVVEACDRVPGIAIGADVVVGFPGEDEASFQRTLEFVDRLPLAYLHVFTYSNRPGTRASRFDGPRDPRATAERAAVLREIARQHREQFAAAHLGRKVEVLFEDVDGRGRPRGLTDNYLRVGAGAEDGALAEEGAGAEDGALAEDGVLGADDLRNRIGRVRIEAVEPDGTAAGTLVAGTPLR